MPRASPVPSMLSNPGLVPSIHYGASVYRLSSSLYSAFTFISPYSVYSITLPCICRLNPMFLPCFPFLGLFLHFTVPPLYIFYNLVSTPLSIYQSLQRLYHHITLCLPRKSHVPFMLSYAWLVCSFYDGASIYIISSSLYAAFRCV